MSEAPAIQVKRPRRGRIVLAIVVLALIALVAFHVLRSKPAKPAVAPQVVTVATATTGSMPETLSELGTVTPVATVTVLPQLSGYLTAVGYREGQDVQKGQFLAQIDPRQYEISKRQAEAQLAKDKAALAQARADLARFTQLNEHKSIAEQTYADQQFLVQQNEAAVKADEANVAQFELDLIYCHITAPVSGRVGLRLVDPGNYVTASSQPGIAVITTMKPTTVQFTVPQTALDKVLQRVNAGAQLPVAVFSSDNARQIATGTLYAINNQMATATGTVTLRATVPNDDEALFPNEFVNVRLLVDTLQNAVLVPTPAVQSGAPGDYVYLVNADNTVSVRKVTLGPSDGQRTVITAGLAAGNVVVTDGMDRLSDGVKIKASAARPGSGASGAAGASAASAATPAAPPSSASNARRTRPASAPDAASTAS
ncbi:efflux RND transporter periplasmic adaptor subunit [Paraburkholderia phytofirmans]|uniref:efflux RND transporter periplasmic adaptor subunit n=1 Tax=Paraburkholderia phytofirmans TaxID=261302 RepID=UPI0038BBC78F